jgi:hypothetical protein
MKTTLLLWASCLWAFTSTHAHLPAPVKLAPNLKNWQANAATETTSGLLLVGRQAVSENRSRLVLTSTDSLGLTRWTRTYPQLKGMVEGYGIATTDSQQIWVAGTQNGIAKVWEINAQNRGDIRWSMALDSGLARTVRSSLNGKLLVTVENDTQLSINCLNANGSLQWKQQFANTTKAKSSLLITREKYIVVAFAGHGIALDWEGNPFWRFHQESAQWHSLFQRANGEVVFVGQQTMQAFGPSNEEAHVVATLPLEGKYAWFRSFGNESTHDIAYQMAERPNGQLVLLAKQGRRFRLLELNQNHTLAKSSWLTDSLSHIQAVALLNRSAWQDKWLLAYNCPDGRVWLQPTHESSVEKEMVEVRFRLQLSDSAQRSLMLRPITEVPIVYQLPDYRPFTYTLRLKDCRGDGYAYLLSKHSIDNQWHEKGWVQLGSCDSLILSPDASEHILLVAHRPYAAPLRLLLESDAYAADSLHPSEPAKTLSEQYPTTFNPQLGIHISGDGSLYMIQNLHPNGWIPIRIDMPSKTLSSKR